MNYGFDCSRAASLFKAGGTHALKGEFGGMNDFEVLAYLIVLAEPVPVG